VQRLAGSAALLARIGETVVVPLVPDHGAEQRLVLQQPFPVAVDESSCRLVRFHRRSPSGEIGRMDILSSPHLLTSQAGRPQLSAIRERFPSSEPNR
jgi:hypothetical protein